MLRHSTAAQPRHSRSRSNSKRVEALAALGGTYIYTHTCTRPHVPPACASARRRGGRWELCSLASASVGCLLRLNLRLQLRVIDVRAGALGAPLGRAIRELLCRRCGRPGLAPRSLGGDAPLKPLGARGGVPRHARQRSVHQRRNVRSRRAAEGRDGPTGHLVAALQHRHQPAFAHGLRQPDQLRRHPLKVAVQQRARLQRVVRVRVEPGRHDQ
mmetsp:Transcript_21501/g.69405  ORF Transcript_21501/g.69405 Transcript_21501/m.69405 type:complete len:214 (-) Transcript_21501:1125-1766(-)